MKLFKEQVPMSIDVATMPLPTQEKGGKFYPVQLARLDPARIPHHVAIIPDGNRRWAKKRFASAQEGHREGADTLMETVRAAKDLGVKIITFFAFSTENWMRPKEEVIALMALFTDYLLEQRKEMVQNGIKLETIGDASSLPFFLNKTIKDSKEATQHCDKIRLVLALNYGSRNELCRAFKAMLHDYDQQLITKDDVNEDTIARYLDTNKWRDPDLLIRTSGELRISNFLLWQLCYTEIHMAPVLWPDFNSHHLLAAILDYQERERRWGKGA